MTKTPRRRTHREPIEALEARRLLSAAAVVHPHLLITPAAAGGSGGYTPSQIAKAYGFDKISFGNGVAADGSGQTIAIVDAFHDPNIVADLKVFDAKFRLPDLSSSSFRQVSQTGGSTRSVSTDAGWASEIALDVEWAHAIAPKANILLVEAFSDNFTDLTAAVNYARNVAGVSVVSMSWGGNEFRGQTSYDATFSTPKNHTGVTFVASSGDDGAIFGAEWPGSSANVLSVGGTVLHADTVGNYTSEIAWNYSTGGVSRYESEPSYQSGVQSSGRRTSPDVSYNASVITGFQVYSSINDAGTVGWSDIGGTSAGAPQWAALVSIANQGRAVQGKAPLDGVASTLPTLYSLYAAPGSAKYATYTANFHDISTGTVVPRSSASTGYDQATGLGSPMADKVVAALMNATTTAVKHAGTGKSGATVSARKFLARDSSDLPVDAVPQDPGAYSVSLIRQAAEITVASPFNHSTAVAPADVATGGTNLRPLTQNPPSPTVPSRLAPVSSLPNWESAPAINFPIASSTDAVAVDSDLSDAVSLTTRAPNFDFSHLQAATAFADAMSTFVHDSTTLATTVLPLTGRSGAWAITGAVVALDAVLIGSWYANRKDSRQSTKCPASPFAFETPTSR